MGETKYFVPDKDFYTKMRGAARGLKELGAVIILELTGMHTKSLAELAPENLRKVGPHHFIYWVAVKPQRKVRQLRAPVPRKDLEIVKEWIDRYGGKRTERTWHRKISEVGERAGYEGIAPMTFRHQRIVMLMDKFNGNVRKVAPLTGATYGTIEKHYAQADPALYEDDELIEED